MKAVEWFAKVEKGDKYLPSKMKQAEILADMNRTDEACRVLREIRADNGKKAQFRLACSDLYMKAGRTKDAYQAADEALKRRRTNPMSSTAPRCLRKPRVRPPAPKRF